MIFPSKDIKLYLLHTLVCFQTIIWHSQIQYAISIGEVLIKNFILSWKFRGKRVEDFHLVCHVGKANISHHREPGSTHKVSTFWHCSDILLVAECSSDIYALCWWKSFILHSWWKCFVLDQRFWWCMVSFTVSISVLGNKGRCEMDVWWKRFSSQCDQNRKGLLKDTTVVGCST